MKEKKECPCLYSKGMVEKSAHFVS
ncbi:hypothetical protein AVEN_247304-1, partial [Araneus ventricosus]